jgi:GT2 family glycosyltransferase
VNSNLLSVSIVIYLPNIEILKICTSSLIISLNIIIKTFNLDKIQIDIIDNSDIFNNNYILEITEFINSFRIHKNIDFNFKSFPNNPGYGTSHNHSLLNSPSKYHLILNPDVILKEDSILKLIEYMESNPTSDIVTPKVFDWVGVNTLTNNQQFLIKRYPSVFQLFLRGFAPQFIKDMFSKTLSSYECKELDFSKTQTNLNIVSGCFMFCKTESLKRVGGFDVNYFLYFEDFDLSLRLERKDYFPEAIIYHKGGNSAKKGWLHRKLFIKSAFQFYQKHGWKWI